MSGASADGIDSAPSAKSDLKFRLERLLGKEYVSDDYVKFRIALAEAQTSAFEGLRDAGIYSGGNRENGNSKLHTPPESTPVNAAILNAYFSRIRKASANYGGESEELFKLAEAHLREDGLLASIVARGILEFDNDFIEECAGKIGIPSDALKFVAHILAAPFAARLSGDTMNAKTFAPTGDAAARCPKCGSAPSLAKLRREDGKRILYCSLCGHGFEYPRLKCPYCGEDEPSGVGVLYTSKEIPCWVEWCSKCSRYVKSFDERRYPEGETFDPYIEETATVYLDLIAEEKDLTRGAQPLSAAVQHICS